MINGRDIEQLDHFGLDLRIEREGSSTVRVVASGELDLSTSTRLEREIEPLIEGGECHELILDLSDLSFLDSTGLRALWGLRQLLQESGGTLVLRSPSEPVMRILRLTRLHKIFQVEER